MARLKHFRAYLDERREVLETTEASLCELQGKYESYFAEVAAARENELLQLIEHTVTDRSVLPSWYNDALDRTQVTVEAEFDAKLAELEARRTEVLAQAEEQRAASLERETRIKKLNAALDREEEELKTRNARLLADIADYNATIAEMGRGFGFFANLFKMRPLARRKADLDAEQRDVAARIEALRARWMRSEGDHAKQEDEKQSNWRELESEAAGLSAKLESLNATRSRVVVRSTVERVLAERTAEIPEAGENDPQCPRCSVRNPESNHFCHICAHRLQGDREDFDGSMAEMAEINRHFARFSEGMESCQQIIGLVRGLKSGLEAFSESVADVQESERTYPLPKLEIEVPAASLQFGRHFEMLRDMSQKGYSVHPRVFASHIETVIDEHLTEDAIQGYFETMGDELSRQADSQWK